MNYKIALASLFLLACTTHPVHRNVSNEDANESPITNITSRATLLYSWTTFSQALKNPASFIKSDTNSAQNCITKIAASQTLVPNCEGNGMAAGPGFYTTDNPFTSHDYGKIVVIVPAIAGDKNVINSDENRPAAGFAVEREVYGRKDIKAISYIFRYAVFTSRALVVRDLSILDTSKARAISVNPETAKKFKDRPTFTCNAETTIDEMLKNWGDNIEFLNLAFYSNIDPSGNNFTENNQLNSAGWLAAAASDAATMPEEVLKQKIKAIRALSKELNDSMERGACNETSTRSQRSCLAKRIYDSAQENLGTDRYPTYAWDLTSTLKAFVILDILTAPEAARIKDSTQLKDLIAQKMQNNHGQAQNVQEAYRCVQHYKAGLEKNNLEHWN